MNARQRAEFESMLIGEAMRRARLKAYDPKRSALWHAMKPWERRFVAVLALPYRVRDAFRRMMRA